MLTNVETLKFSNNFPVDVIRIPGAFVLEDIKELTFEGEGECFVMALPAKNAAMYQVGETYCLSVCTTVVREGAP